jgi:hypothetical protein
VNPDLSYVKLASWHLLRPGRQDLTLCGQSARAHPDKAKRQRQINGYAIELPLGEPSCESCLRLEPRWR